MPDSDVTHIIEHASTTKVVATLKKTMDDADARVDTLSKVLQCACGTDCVAFQKQQREWNKKGSIPIDTRAMTVLPDIGKFSNPHQAPSVVCHGLHVFEETDNGKRKSGRVRGLAPNETHKSTPLERKPRLGCNQGGCIVCADCVFVNNFIDKATGNCKGCLRRKVMLPPSLRDDPNVCTLFIPKDDRPQLHQISAINKEVDALKPILKNARDLNARVAKEVANQHKDRNGQHVGEYEDEQLCITTNNELGPIGITADALEPAPNANASATDAVLVDDRETKKVRAEKEAGNALFQATQTRKELVATESELQNCKDQRGETQDAATKTACDDSIANIEARKEGIVAKLAAQEEQQASAFKTYYDLSKPTSERPYAELSKEEQDVALATFRETQGAEIVTPNPEKPARKPPVRQQTAKQIKDAKYAEILDAVQKQQAKPDHVHVNDAKTNAAEKKRKAVLDQQEKQWRSERFEDVRKRRDEWFADATIQNKHRKFLKEALSEKLAEQGIEADVFNELYSEASTLAQEKLDAFQGACTVEGGEEAETAEQTADRKKRKRKYDDYYASKYEKAYQDDDGEDMPLSDQEDADDDSALKKKWRAKAGEAPVVFATWIKTEEGRAVAAKCGVLETLESVIQQEGGVADGENSSSPPSPAASATADAAGAADAADAVEANLN